MSETQKEKAAAMHEATDIGTKLTEAQLVYVRWIGENKTISAGWLRDGRSAYGPPETWNQHYLDSGMSRIVVSAEDHFATRAYVDVTGSRQEGIYRLSPAGSALLRSLQENQT